MKALKLQFIPNKKQYKILDEMFWKWASIANRYNRYSHSNNLEENDIKEKLTPKENIQEIQFSRTMVNQRAKQDNADLKRAMEEQGKQKEEELVKLENRISDIEEMFNDEDKRETNLQRPSNIKPKGWFKFHTFNYWEKEIKKLKKQAEKRKKTIEKIKQGRIYFKPKRTTLWSNMWKINFKSKKLFLKPFVNQEIILDFITEPIQPVKNSSLKSKQFMESQIKDFVNFSTHSNFFGLAKNEKPLIEFKIYEKIIVPKIKGRFPKEEKQEDKRLDEFNKRVLNYFAERVKKKIGRYIGKDELNLISKEANKIWNNIGDLWKIREFLNEINEIKKQKHLPDKSKLLEVKWKSVNEIQENLFSEEYLNLISHLKDELTKQKRYLLNTKYSNFDKKIKKLKKDYQIEFDEVIIKEEGKNAFLEPDNFLEYNFSEQYINLINEMTENLLEYEGFLDFNKYPILFRKPKNKTKKIHRLKPQEWKYYIQFGYEQINTPKLDTKNILGIDRGLIHILAYSVFESEKNVFIINKLEPNPIVGWKWRLRKLKRSLQNLERKWRAKENIKLQENQMKKRLKGIEDKIENLYHNISRKIVNLAKEKNSCIVFEKLEGQGLKQHARKKSGRLKTLNYALSLFDYGKIAKLIKYKAELEGIIVYQIDPAYTSQNCAKCILELGRFAQPEKISYLEDLDTGTNLNKKLLEGTNLKEAKVDKKLAKKIYLTAQNKEDKETKLFIEIKYGKVIFSTGYYEQKETKQGKLKEGFEIDENIAEFQTRKEGDKTAILDYVYTRGKEIIEGKTKYTGRKKVGYCMRHKQIDADLNASRVIALCKYFDINNPKIWK